MLDAGIRNKGWSQNHTIIGVGGAHARGYLGTCSVSVINPCPIVADDTMPSSASDKLDDLQKTILFIIDSADADIDEAHLQKMVFQALMATGHNPQELGFRPGIYGPCSTRVSECAETLADMGFLASEGETVSVAPDATETVASLDLPETDRFRIGMISEYVSGLDREELVLVTYADETESAGERYLEDSEVKDKVLEKRVDIAMRMYETRKATLERASELAGTDIRSFGDLVSERGIRRCD